MPLDILLGWVLTILIFFGLAFGVAYLARWLATYMEIGPPGRWIVVSVALLIYLIIVLKIGLLSRPITF